MSVCLFVGLFSCEQWKNEALKLVWYGVGPEFITWGPENVEFSVHSVFQDGLPLRGPPPFCPPGFYSQYAYNPKKTENHTAVRLSWNWPTS